MPDTTWDLAWLTAAFATMPTNRFGTATEMLASKLMDGQILDGTARGLWGPTCINTPLLADMATKLQRLAAAIPEARKRAASGSPDAIRMQNKAEGEYEETLREIKRVALSAFKGLKRPDGSLSAIFLPLAGNAATDGASPPVAAEAAYNLLMQKADPEVLAADYPVAYEPEKTAESLILEALSGIPDPQPEAGPAEDTMEPEQAPEPTTGLQDDETL